MQKLTKKKVIESVHQQRQYSRCSKCFRSMSKDAIQTHARKVKKQKEQALYKSHLRSNKFLPTSKK